MSKTKGKIIIMIAVFITCCGITFAAPFFLNLFSGTIRTLLNCIIYVLMGICAVVGMKFSGMEIKSLFSFNNLKQYLWAIIICVFLSLVFAVIPILCGGNLIGAHIDLTAKIVIKNALFFVVFVGPVEELLFRAYIQDVLVDILTKHKWIGVVIASLIFGLWHIINGGLFQVLFATLIGSIVGFAKYLLKNCTYISVALGHGLYDFSNIIVRAFMI